MKPDTGPGVMDMVVVILSPLIVAGLMVIFLLGGWMKAVFKSIWGDPNKEDGPW